MTFSPQEPSCASWTRKEHLPSPWGHTTPTRKQAVLVLLTSQVSGLVQGWPCMEHGATRAGTWQQQPYLPTCPEWPAPGTRPSFQDCSSWGPMLRHGVKLQPATLVFHIGTCLSSCKAAEVGPSARAPCTHMETWMKLLKELCV